MKSFQNILEEKGIRPSFHRLKILEYLDKHRVHPTVDNIYAALIKTVPTISKTTIYNTLKLFVDNGLISDLTISGYDVRYDGEVRPHSHFLCKSCDGVFDVEELNCPHLKKEVEGHKVEEIHLYFKGICNTCLRKNKGKK